MRRIFLKSVIVTLLYTLLFGAVIFIPHPFKFLPAWMLFLSVLLSPFWLTMLFGSDKAITKMCEDIDGYGGPPGWE